LRFYRGGPCVRCARACEEYLTQSKLRKALPKATIALSLISLPSQKRRHLTRQTQRPLGPLLRRRKKHSLMKNATKPNHKYFSARHIKPKPAQNRCG
jgi:hypothetical protein